MNTLSDTQIASKALVLLGQNPIANISDATVPNAVKCNAAYPSERDAMLREWDWNFARSRAQLQQGPTPAFGWLYAYPVPADFAAARVVNGWIHHERMSRWAVEGQFIMTNAPGPDGITCNLVYTRLVTETGFFDSLFADLLSIRIASVLAMSILKDLSKANAMMGLYARRMPTAKRVDASEQSAEHGQQGGSWLEGRGGQYDEWGR